MFGSLRGSTQVQPFEVVFFYAFIGSSQTISEGNIQPPMVSVCEMLDLLKQWKSFGFVLSAVYVGCSVITADNVMPQYTSCISTHLQIQCIWCYST